MKQFARCSGTSYRKQAVLDNENHLPALEDVKQEAGKEFNGLDKILCRKGEKE